MEQNKRHPPVAVKLTVILRTQSSIEGFLKIKDKVKEGGGYVQKLTIEICKSKVVTKSLKHWYLQKSVNLQYRNTDELGWHPE